MWFYHVHFSLVGFKKIFSIKVLGGFWPARYVDLSFPYSDTSFCPFNKLCKHFNQFSNSYQLQTLTSSSTRNIFQGSIFFCNSFIKTFPLLVTKFLQPPILLAATLNGKWTDNLIPNFSNQLPWMHLCWFYVDIRYLSTYSSRYHTNIVCQVSWSISAVVSKLGRYNVVIWQEYKH